MYVYGGVRVCHMREKKKEKKIILSDDRMTDDTPTGVRKHLLQSTDYKIQLREKRER